MSPLAVTSSLTGSCQFPRLRLNSSWSHLRFFYVNGCSKNRLTCSFPVDWQSILSAKYCFAKALEVGPESSFAGIDQVQFDVGGQALCEDLAGAECFHRLAINQRICRTNCLDRPACLST